MRTYQLVLVLRPTLSDPEKKKITDLIKGWLKDVKIVKEDEWGKKPLSYKIKKEDSGFFLNYYLETDGVVPFDFEKRLLANEDVLRHLLVKSEIKNKKSKVEKTEKQAEEKPKAKPTVKKKETKTKKK